MIQKINLAVQINIKLKEESSRYKCLITTLKTMIRTTENTFMDKAHKTHLKFPGQQQVPGS
jgi:hypothetical protein